MKAKRLILLASAFALLCVTVLATWMVILPGVSSTAIESAIYAVKAEIGLLPVEGTLMVVDFSQPSFRKRLAIIDLETGGKSFHQVAHGRNSGSLFATRFSDTIGSNMSSLGLFRVQEEYEGKNGLSLRLIGVSRDLNCNAEQRGIIIHSADYVSGKTMLINALKGFRIGRSEGCFVLSRQGFMALSENLRRPAFLFAYASTQ